MKLCLYFLKRGLWLVFVELFIITLGWSFNPTFPYFNLQVIWVIGVSMIVLSVMIYMNRLYILLAAILIIAAHNNLDQTHVQGNSILAFFWSVLHEPGDFIVGPVKIFVRYPLLLWIGIIALGYYFWTYYNSLADATKRKKVLLYSGLGSITIFIILRYFNFYGDPASFGIQKNIVYCVLAFLNVSKYPPSFLYILITLGPAMVFLSLAEKPHNAIMRLAAVFGRAPFFYYVVHIYLIHFFAIMGAVVTGYHWSEMILSDRVNRVAGFKGYGFSLPVVYLIWIILVIVLSSCCKWFDTYKRTHLSSKPLLNCL